MNNRIDRARPFLSTFLFVIAMSVLPVVDAGAQPAARPAEKWATAWAASVQGRYPSGNPSAGGPGVRAEFVPEITTGGAGDKLHPKRTGYLAMGGAIDFRLLDAPGRKAPWARRGRRPRSAGAAGTADTLAA